MNRVPRATVRRSELDGYYDVFVDLPAVNELHKSPRFPVGIDSDLLARLCSSLMVQVDGLPYTTRLSIMSVEQNATNISHAVARVELVASLVYEGSIPVSVVNFPVANNSSRPTALTLLVESNQDSSALVQSPLLSLINSISRLNHRIAQDELKKVEDLIKTSGEAYTRSDSGMDILADQIESVRSRVDPFVEEDAFFKLTRALEILGRET